MARSTNSFTDNLFSSFSYVLLSGPFYYRSALSRRRVILQVLVIDAIPIFVCVVVPSFWHGEIIVALSK